MKPQTIYIPQTINRTWFKCKDCKCCWYDDCNNNFDYCPECGSSKWNIIDEEVII